MSVSTGLTSFQQELATTAQQVAAALPATANATIDAGIAEVEAAGTAGHGLRPGQRAPDFTLPDASGTAVTLSLMS